MEFNEEEDFILDELDEAVLNDERRGSELKNIVDAVEHAIKYSDASVIVSRDIQRQRDLATKHETSAAVNAAVEVIYWERKQQDFIQCTTNDEDNNNDDDNAADNQMTMINDPAFSTMSKIKVNQTPAVAIQITYYYTKN